MIRHPHSRTGMLASKRFSKGVGTCLITLACCASANPALAYDLMPGTLLENASFVDATHLIELKQGSELSLKAQALQDGGYELAQGQSNRFNRWYSSRWTDAGMTWMIYVTRNFGIIFGGTTGERGKKYTIDPSAKLGFILQMPTGRNAFLTLRASTILGGRLHEKTCTADYGEIGGVQTVNCRLAAGTMAPAETLNYLLNERPINHTQTMLQFNWQF